MTSRAFGALTALLIGCAPAARPIPATPAAADTVAEAAPAAAIPPPQKHVSVEGITEYRLANGLRVLLFPDASKDTMTVNITYFVGSRHEGYGEAGMAHLLEHMVFKGTERHQDIWKLLQDHGARFNGTTWYDRTNYYETMPATADNLAFALRMEADRMVNSLIAPEQLAREFSVVRNEFEMGENSPLGVLEERIVSAAYLWHNYGKSTIGNRSDIERVPAEALRAFYRKYYRPENAMLVVAGKFDEARALELIGAEFGPLQNPDQPLAETYTTEPVQDGEKQVILRRTGDTHYVGVLYHGVAGAADDFASLETAASILTDEPSGRLYKALVETKKATRVWSAAYPTREPGYVLFWAEAPAGAKIEPLRDELIALIEGFAATEIPASDVARQVRRGHKQFELMMADSQQVAIMLTEFAAMGDWRLMFVARDRLDKVTAANVAAAAERYFKRANRTVGLFLPTEDVERAPLPEAPKVAELVEGYQGRGALAAGEAFEASFDNIEARTERRTLAGGMKVAMLPKQTRGNKVKAQIGLRFGTAKSLRGKTAAASMLAEMLLRGSESMGYQQLKDRLDELTADVSVAASAPGEVEVSIETTRDNLIPVIELVADVLRHPALAPAEFDVVKREALTQLDAQKQNPQALAIIAMQRALNPHRPDDVRYVPTVEESIARVQRASLRDLRAVHDQMWGAGDALAVVIGDFDGAEVSDALQRTLGDWKAKQPYARVADEYVASPAGDEVIQTPDKKMAIIVAAKTLKLKVEDPDYPALAMAGYVFGGGGSSRVLTRLRHQEGLSYGAFGAIQGDELDDTGALYGGAILAPENADKGMRFLLEELHKLVAEGVGADELAQAKAAYAKQVEGQLASDDFLIDKLYSGLETGRTLAFDKELTAKIDALTPEQIAKAIEQHLAVDDMMKVKAGDLPAAK
jgi:zinc protease